MNEFNAHLRATLWWLVPLAFLLVVIGWEVDWGAEVRKRPPPAEPVAPKPVAASLLPEYVIEGGVAGRTETVNRTLFNPTRRPAPVAVADAAKPQMQRGLYTLTGSRYSLRTIWIGHARSESLLTTHAWSNRPAAASTNNNSPRLVATSTRSGEAIRLA